MFCPSGRAGSNPASGTMKNPLRGLYYRLILWQTAQDDGRTYGVPTTATWCGFLLCASVGGFATALSYGLDVGETNYSFSAENAIPFMLVPIAMYLCWDGFTWAGSMTAGGAEKGYQRKHDLIRAAKDLSKDKSLDKHWRERAITIHNILCHQDKQLARYSVLGIDPKIETDTEKLGNALRSIATYAIIGPNAGHVDIILRDIDLVLEAHKELEYV